MNLKRALIILLMAAFIVPSITVAQEGIPEPVTARFLVTKTFADGFDGEVEVTITCNTGTPLVQSSMISEGNPVAFVVEELIIVDGGDDGATNCVVTEDGETGYNPVFNASGAPATSTASCLFTADPSDEANLDPEVNFCDITNVPAPVTVSVTKVWDISGAVGDDVNTNVTVYAQSEGEITNGYVCGYDDMYWCKSLYFNGSETESLEVVPAYDGVTVELYENVGDSSVESDNTCGGGTSGSVTVYPNQGASCTFTNTVFFEGIPTLSQYGLAIMALLMLGVGFVGFRRFV